MSRQNLEIEGISEYKKVIDHVFDNGEWASPRGLNTLEIAPISITILDPLDRVFFDINRNLNIAFSLAEWLWIIGGRNDLAMLEFYNSNMKKYSDDGVSLHGAYGKRIRMKEPNSVDQLAEILDKLRSDKFSRQAVITIFDPSVDYQPTKDVPCTVTFQFILRNDLLRMITFMRSNDVYFGFPNDIFNFTFIQEVIANSLGVGVGTYTHNVGSFHLYETEFEKAKYVIEPIGDICSPSEIDCSDIGFLLFNEEKIRRGDLLLSDLNNKKNGYCEVKSALIDILRIFIYYRLLKMSSFDEIVNDLKNRIPNIYDQFILRSLRLKSVNI